MNNVPKIRFPGFTEPWEQRKLSEFVDKAVDNRGKTPPLDENGTHPLIEVAALGGVHPDYSKVEKYLNDDSFENNLRAYIKEGDILFTTVGSIGLVSLMDSREEAAIAQNIVAFRAKENFVPEYLYALFSNDENQYKAKRIVMGAVQPSIKVSQLVDVEYMLTENVKEQKKIGAYFSNLDNLITLHQRKCDKVKELKKAMLKKMFPKNGEKKPEIRFPGFTDDWEQRKLGELMNVTSVKRIHQSDWTDSGVRFLRARDIVAASKNEEPDDYLYISKEKYEEYSALSGKVDIDDLLVTGVGTIGVPYLVENLEPLYFKDGNIIWFQNQNEIDGKFLYYSFIGNGIQSFIKASAGTGTVGTYTIDTGKKTPIQLPSKEEQKKIGEYLSQLDNLITLHQRKCDKLIELKKSMLQKMFI